MSVDPSSRALWSQGDISFPDPVLTGLESEDKSTDFTEDYRRIKGTRLSRRVGCRTTSFLRKESWQSGTVKDQTSERTPTWILDRSTQVHRVATRVPLVTTYLLVVPLGRQKVVLFYLHLSGVWYTGRTIVLGRTWSLFWGNHKPYLLQWAISVEDPAPDLSVYYKLGVVEFYCSGQKSRILFVCSYRCY